MSDVFLGLQWQSLMPELVVCLFALIAPLLALWDTDRAGMRQFTLIGLGGALLMALGSLFKLQFTIPIPKVDIELGMAFPAIGAVAAAAGLFLVMPRGTRKPSVGATIGGLVLGAFGLLVLYLYFVLGISGIHLG
ncbi:MAG: hypothetical protein LC620_00505, partial [Halobacteriales archaeon]|nr:hypothetical protein [Halobacteriales archaeon]